MACMGETPSAQPAGGGSSSSAPTISMTPVEPALLPQFPHSQHMADGPGRGNQTSPDPSTKGATTREVPVTTVTMPSIMVSIIEVTEVPGGKTLRGAASWVE